jgi:ATP-dependent DNA ligase
MDGATAGWRMLGRTGVIAECTGYHRADGLLVASGPAMTDQLSLELEAALPHLPARLRPMLPRPLPTPFDSSDHVFEPSWGGQRALAFLEPAFDQDDQGRYHTADGAPSVRLVDAGGRDLADRLGELGGLALRIEARSAVLDGELIVVDGAGRPDPATLEARLGGGPGPDVAYLAFDLLYLDGRPLLGQPLARRRDALRRILRPGPEVVAVPSIVGEGRALHDAATAQGLAGTMARQRTSPYLPGIRSRLWRFVAIGVGRVPSVSGAASGEAARMPGPDSESPPEPERPTLGLDAGPGTTGAVLAVFRRLPLDVDVDR